MQKWPTKHYGKSLEGGGRRLLYFLHNITGLNFMTANCDVVFDTIRLDTVSLLKLRPVYT